ncbi:histidine kinase [Marinobacterium nitratireducens]|uniref:Histidine kinase n=1 Tax=Marinobacterium nitratireducens TaxID=518897 RepID=A0A918DXL8_9GAMM|nr:oxygenase MpaB family protein [Marinobacterium nitratireducens]GGO87397.1 histidine kinase [Marinobacterium nitratireducens]
MEIIRKRIERQVFALTGLALGEIDYEHPAGDPGLFGPESICWRVHGDFPSMLCGGISALMLQMLHPAALAGVWDHSRFRDDMLGRLRRTSQFIAATTFATTPDAQRLIARVRNIHSAVSGTTADGQSYAASDPQLLTWVHVAEVSSFFKAYQRYCDPAISASDRDRYYDEVARIAEALGATDIPRTGPDIDAYLQRMRPRLRYDERTAQVLSLLLKAPSPNRMTQPVGRLMTAAAIDLLPDWAGRMANLTPGPARRRLTRAGMDQMASTLRWAIRNGASHRARRRMGIAV